MMFGAVMLVSAVAGAMARQEIDVRPGAVIPVPYPGAIQWLPRPQPVSSDCEGCGAPLKAHLHHCEYCRREK